MSRYKSKPGRRAQLKRKRELDESGNVDTTPAKRPALDSKPAKRSANDSELVKTPTPDTLEAANPKKEHPPAPDAVFDPALLADHFAKSIRKSYPNSSSIELDERYLPAKAFLDTADYEKDRVAANLPDFLERFSVAGKDGLSTCDGKASPHTLVVASSGMRTADLYRELRVFQNEESKVGKLIAKHMKLKQNIEYMQENKVGIAISTPIRFKQLMDADALKIKTLRRIVVDGSYRDEKKNTIFMMNQNFQPLVDLLNEESIRQRYGAEEDRIDILLF